MNLSTFTKKTRWIVLPSVVLLWAFGYQQPKEFTFRLTEQEYAEVQAGLNERPMKLAYPVAVKLDNQFRQQLIDTTKKK